MLLHRVKYSINIQAYSGFLETI